MIDGKKIGLCFCHGWGFSPDYWKPLLSYFSDYPTKLWNLGYFGTDSWEIPAAQELGPPIKWIAVGHSIGFRKLMESPVPWIGAVSVQGFHDFLGTKPDMRKIRSRALQQMINGWQRAPMTVLHNFYLSCGSPETPTQKPNFDLLGEDLHALEKPGNFRWPLAIPHCVLGSQNDTIVPLDLITSEWDGSRMSFSPHGGHALGFFESDFVAEWIHSFIREIPHEPHSRLF